MSKELYCNFCGKSRKDIVNLVQGPETTTGVVYICNECIDFSYDIIHKDDKKIVNKPSPLTPEDIKKHLDEYVIGQDDAKITLSVAIYNHFKRINNLHIDIEKSNILLIGQSGTGKTLLVKTVAKLLDLPFTIADATTITEAGYVGEDADKVIERLLEEAKGNVEKAQKGIIFIDEIDKKSRKSEVATLGRDISGEGVQQALLKLIEGTKLTISHNNKKYGTQEQVEIDTKDILFIAGGAFIGLEDIVKKSKKGKSSIGFSAPITNNTNALLKETTPDDLIKYGIIPEFIGRFPVVVSMDEMTEEILVRIITEPKNSVLTQFKSLFSIDGIDLDFEECYIKFVAQECMKKKTGARGLRSVIEKTLLPIQFVLPKLKENGLEKIVITQTGEPIYIYGKKEIHSKAE